MGQSIAILVGNSKYEGLSTLECCANDVVQMRKLLAASEKFDQIIDFVDQTASKVKDNLRTITEAEDGFDEVLFYFTGHGLSNSSDFYMCFEAFEEASPKYDRTLSYRRI